jgi:phage tail sheath protein FI
LVQVPPSVAVLGAFGKNDALAHPWYAPAGFSRGALGTTDSVAVQLSQENLDSLYSVSINSLTTFPGRGPVVWGQKTLLAKSSAFDRINVRRLLIELRRRVRKVALRVLFQQNREATLQQFKDLVTPILREIKTQKGVDNFQVDIDTTTTTEADIQNKTIRGKIWVAPTKTLEFVSLDFVLNNNVGAQVG